MRIAHLLTVSALATMGAGCGSSNGNRSDAGPHIPDFSACSAADAGPYVAGLMETSKSGAFTATLVSIVTAGTGAPVDMPAVGHATFVVTVVATEGSGPPPAGLTLTADKPYMPFHKHYASTAPVVNDMGGGNYELTDVNLFMPGYFEITIELQPPPDGADGSVPAVDKVVFPVCVPT